jgi:4-alpha-glucanotransferase
MHHQQRSTGLLLHITSLGGPYGIGSLGKNARFFADFLRNTGVRYWQILPFNPVISQFGFSPYASTSAFAGNSMLIDCDSVIDHYSFTSQEMLPPIMEPSDFISYETVEDEYNRFFSRVYHAFSTKATSEEKNLFEKFRQQNSYWLEDYALYTVLSDIYRTYAWTTWPQPLSERDSSAIAKAHNDYQASILQIMFIQFLFFTQWHDLKKYCNKKFVEIIGDIPIYISYDSADAWANPGLFLLNQKGKPDPVAGVPPDYFSETGQRWGNPIYRWFENGSPSEMVYEWWYRRFSHLLGVTDVIRIDHFRAFESFWAIPEDEKTAIVGKWEKGPGKDIFDFLKAKLGSLPFIAEDLGMITPQVSKLRNELGLPGMKVLQFAFDFTPDNDYLPHSIDDPNTILYTGTHDNNTSNGWFYGTDINQETRDYIKEYLDIENNSSFHKKFIKTALRSTAQTVIIPVQDLLGFSGEFRTNTPGTMNHSNWRWQLKNIHHISEEALFLKRCNTIYHRLFSPEKS